MRLKYQLFFVLLAASAMLIVLMFLISSWSFSRGFLSYINSAEEQRLQPVLASVVAEYEKAGDWSWADKESAAWRNILYEHGLLTPRRRPAREPVAGRRGDGGGRSDDQSNSPRRPRPARPSGRDGALPVLANSDMTILIGGRRSAGDKNISWLDVVSGEQVVGYLGFRKLSELNSNLDQAFELQQRSSFAWGAAAMALLSALLSIPLASWLVKPLLTLKQAISEVSQGNYGHRIKLKRKDEIGDLANGINRLGQTLEQNREARHRWVAEISHELRTPVAVLQAELEALQDGVRTMNRDAVDSIHGEVRRLAHLIDDLHQLSKTDLGALEYRMAPLCLRELVEKQLQSNKAILNDAGLATVIEAADKHYLVSGDTQRLQQLVANLLQNSIRYTDAPGQIKISFAVDKEQVVLCWEDSPPGVSDDEISRLFEPLFRAEQSRSREHGGAGLGLSIVTRIVQAHGGSVTASHAELGGLQLVISLPGQLHS